MSSQSWVWVGQENRAGIQDPDAAESPAMCVWGVCSPQGGAGTVTPTRASGGSHEHWFPGNPSSGTFRATWQGGLEDPAGPISCLRALGPPLCCLVPGLGLGVRTQPALDRALLSANPRLTPAPVAGDAEPPPGGLGDVEIDVNPRQGL
uniref:Uncharacterized protein n=1 Tax=Rangifer tarandus platyrhynchus TaxID=3082113 RepID=A0ACB0DPU0_RANTA|nr:unnamed protein product [Rangifer tarandus platyrhynchus]